MAFLRLLLVKKVLAGKGMGSSSPGALNTHEVLPVFLSCLSWNLTFCKEIFQVPLNTSAFCSSVILMSPKKFHPKVRLRRLQSWDNTKVWGVSLNSFPLLHFPDCPAGKSILQKHPPGRIIQDHRVRIGRSLALFLYCDGIFCCCCCYFPFYKHVLSHPPTESCLQSPQKIGWWGGGEFSLPGLKPCLLSPIPT